MSVFAAQLLAIFSYNDEKRSFTRHFGKYNAAAIGFVEFLSASPLHILFSTVICAVLRAAPAGGTSAQQRKSSKWQQARFRGEPSASLCQTRLPSNSVRLEHLKGTFLRDLRLRTCRCVLSRLHHQHLLLLRLLRRGVQRPAALRAKEKTQEKRKTASRSSASA